MPWWGWLILSLDIVFTVYIARKRANSMIDTEKHGGPSNEDYVFAVVVGVLNGIFWPIFLFGVFLVFLLFPSKALGLLEPFVPEFLFSDEEEEDKSDEEVRKEIDRLRREYTMPKWKRFILRMIRV